MKSASVVAMLDCSSTIFKNLITVVTCIYYVVLLLAGKNLFLLFILMSKEYTTVSITPQKKIYIQIITKMIVYIY